MRMLNFLTRASKNVFAFLKENNKNISQSTTMEKINQKYPIQLTEEETAEIFRYSEARERYLRKFFKESDQPKQEKKYELEVKTEDMDTALKAGQLNRTKFSIY